MAFPKPLRIQLGLSQAEFADLLGTNAGQLSMAESGLRDLPTALLEIAYGLEKTLNSVKKQTADNNKVSARTITLLEKQIRSGQLKLDTLQMQEGKLLDKMNAARCMLALAVSETYTTTLPTADNEEVNLQMAVLKRKASKKIILLEAKYVQLQLSIASQNTLLAKAKELATT